MATEALTLSDREIIRRCRRGDEAGFVALMTVYQQYVLRLCWRLVGCREEALDLTQEVFVRLLRSLKTLNPQPSLRPWLRRVTINTCLKAMAREGHRQQHLAACTADDGQMVALSNADTVAAEVEARLSLSSVAQGLRELSPPQRTVLVLKVMEGLSYQHIGELLEMPVGTVKSHLARARRQLRQGMLSTGGT